METVKVNKALLYETVSTNRDNHRAQFLTAQTRYREKVIQLLDERLRQVRDGDPISLTFGLPEPQDYTQDYDAALAMLKWSVDDQVELDQRSFEQLVLNRWAWARAFGANTQVYLADDR
jgi:hypothetical protein